MYNLVFPVENAVSLLFSSDECLLFASNLSSYYTNSKVITIAAKNGQARQQSHTHTVEFETYLLNLLCLV